MLYLRSREARLFDLTDPGAAPVSAGDQPQTRRETVLAAYWAARVTGDWEPVISQLGALARQLPGDQDVEQAYQDARLAARYEQGRRAEQEQDWPRAVAHYRAVSDTQPEYRDVAARLGGSSRRRDIAALQEQLRAMFTAGEFQAVAGIADRLAELDPSAADPGGLTTQARQRLQQSQADLPPAEPLSAAIATPGTGPAQHPRPVSSTATAANDVATVAAAHLNTSNSATSVERDPAPGPGPDSTPLGDGPSRRTRILTNAVSVARSITDERSKVTALADIATALAATDPDQAERLIADADRIAQSITEMAFAGLGRGRHRGGAGSYRPRPRRTHRPVDHLRPREGKGAGLYRGGGGGYRPRPRRTHRPVDQLVREL